MPIQVFGYPTTADALLLALKAQLVNANLTMPSGNLLRDEQVRITLETENEIDDDPTGDQFLTIAPLEMPIYDPAVTGGGNELVETDGVFEIVFYSRYEVDYVHVDVQALTDQSLGILVAWRQILKLLHLFVPMDAENNGLVCWPIKCRGWKIPKRRPKSPWLRIPSTWSVVFVQDMS